MPITNAASRYAGQQIICPCGFEYVHLRPSHVEISSRGSVALLMACENGHEFFLSLTFHKGETFITVDGLRDAPEALLGLAP